jgi:hypothetical protein
MVHVNINCRKCNHPLICDTERTIDTDPRAVRLILYCDNYECLLEDNVQHDKDVYLETFQEVR